PGADNPGTADELLSAHLGDCSGLAVASVPLFAHCAERLRRYDFKRAHAEQCKLTVADAAEHDIAHAVAIDISDANNRPLRADHAKQLRFEDTKSIHQIQREHTVVATEQDIGAAVAVEIAESRNMPFRTDKPQVLS